MIGFKCPVCGRVLISSEKTVRCGAGHSFDIARQGYVNLLMSNVSSAKRHGDDEAMVTARTEFLEKGYYSPLRDAIVREAVDNCTSNEVTLLDAGCGEGWYTEGVVRAFESAGKTCTAVGIDISRKALIRASKRRCASLAVAGVNAVPLLDGSCDAVINVFAPEDAGEFFRVLKPGGVLIRAVPLEDHLMGLKKAVYEKPYLNKTPEYSPEGFTEIARNEIRGTLRLTDRRDIFDLFMMTPYFYKTGRRDQQKLLELDALTTEISFCVFTLRKDAETDS